MSGFEKWGVSVANTYFSRAKVIEAVKGEGLVRRLREYLAQYDCRFTLNQITCVTYMDGTNSNLARHIANEILRVRTARGIDIPCRVVCMDESFVLDSELLPHKGDCVLVCCDMFYRGEAQWTARHLKNTLAEVLPCVLISSPLLRDDDLDYPEDDLALKRFMYIKGWGVITLIALDHIAHQQLAQGTSGP